MDINVVEMLCKCLSAGHIPLKLEARPQFLFTPNRLGMGTLPQTNVAAGAAGG